MFPVGRSYLFECPTCSYRAAVSGGVDRGLHFAVRTIACLDCKELYDAVTDLKLELPRAPGPGCGALKTSRMALAGTTRILPSPPTFLAALDRLPPGSAKGFQWVRFKTVCPVVARHRTRAWNSPGKCPKCGFFLEQCAIPFRIWD